VGKRSLHSTTSATTTTSARWGNPPLHSTTSRTKQDKVADVFVEIEKLGSLSVKYCDLLPSEYKSVPKLQYR